LAKIAMAVLLVVAILVALTGGGRKPKKIHPGQPLPPK
jgi:predicted small lipoprotein YifL